MSLLCLGIFRNSPCDQLPVVVQLQLAKHCSMGSNPDFFFQALLFRSCLSYLHMITGIITVSCRKGFLFCYRIRCVSGLEPFH